MTLNLPPNAPNCDANLIPGQRYTDADTGFVWVYQGTRNNANGDAVPIWLPLNEATQGNIIYRGPINLTQDPATQYADIVSGNVFNITTGADPVDSSLYPGLTGDQSEGGQIIFDGTNYHRISTVVPDATETDEGIIRIATQAEVTAGTSAITAVVPAYLKTELDKQLTAPIGGTDGQWLQRVSGAGSWQDLPRGSSTQLGIVQLAVAADLQNTPLSETLVITPAVLMGALDQISAVPTGVVQWYAGSTPPAGGWLECNGQAITQVDYPALFAIVGANVPDLRGEFVRGWDHGRGVDSTRALLSSQGFSTSADELSINDPGHGHSGSGSSSQSVWAATGSSGVVFDSPANRKMQAKSVGFDVSVGSNTTGITLNGGSDETRPRNIAMMGIIKT